MTLDDVAIDSGGVRLAGHLRIPPGDGPHPAVVLTGPFTGVKEQVTGTYAAALAGQGYVTLAFDHRNFGGSGGEPRQHEDAAGKARDLLDATSYLALHPAVDRGRIGCVGICLGGSYALRHAAVDPRIRALALVAGGYNNPGDMQRGMGAEQYRAVLAELAAVAEAAFRTGETAYLPAVAPDGGEAAMGGDEPWAYYGTDRSASPGWVNRVSRLSIRELLTLDATSAADLIGATPTLVVHGTTDAYCSPEGAQAVYDRVTAPKEVLWLATANHIDLYDNPAFVQPAVDAVARWLDTHLGAESIPA